MYETKRHDGGLTLHRKIYNKLIEKGWEKPVVRFCTIENRRGWWAWNKICEGEPKYLGKDPLLGEQNIPKN